MTEVTVASIGLVLVILGFVLASAALILLAIRGAGGRARGGGVLLIGPVPIIFGTDRDSVKVLMILAIVLIAVVLLFILLPSLLMSR